MENIGVRGSGGEVAPLLPVGGHEGDKDPVSGDAAIGRDDANRLAQFVPKPFR